MQLEVLNTVVWVVIWLCVLSLFIWLKKKTKNKVLTLRGLGCVFLLSTLVSYSQFFTLTEKADINTATTKFTYNQQNSKLLDSYLEENQNEHVVTSQEIMDTFVKEQQKKSSELAESILLESSKGEKK